jgi:hypothetical protein
VWDLAGVTLCISRAEVPAFPYDIRVLGLEDESGAAGLVFILTRVTGIMVFIRVLGICV